MSYQSVRKLVTGVLVMVLIASLIGCTPQPKPDADKPEKQKDLSKDHILTALSSKTDVRNITWSPNDTMAAYLQAGKPEKNGVDEAYLWTVGEDQPTLVRDVKPTTHGFSWAPDSSHFLISEKLGEGVESSIVIVVPYMKNPIRSRA